MSKVSHRLFDADSHFYEPRAAEQKAVCRDRGFELVRAAA